MTTLEASHSLPTAVLTSSPLMPTTCKQKHLSLPSSSLDVSVNMHVNTTGVGQERDMSRGLEAGAQLLQEDTM